MVSSTFGVIKGCVINVSLKCGSGNLHLKVLVTIFKVRARAI